MDGDQNTNTATTGAPVEDDPNATPKPGPPPGGVFGPIGSVPTRRPNIPRGAIWSETLAKWTMPGDPDYGVGQMPQVMIGSPDNQVGLGEQLLSQYMPSLNGPPMAETTTPSPQPTNQLIPPEGGVMQPGPFGRYPGELYPLPIRPNPPFDPIREPPIVRPPIVGPPGLPPPGMRPPPPDGYYDPIRPIPIRPPYLRPMPPAPKPPPPRRTRAEVEAARAKAAAKRAAAPPKKKR